jgi:MFS family permease
MASAMPELLSRMKLLAPLRVRSFRILWAGMTISLIGDGVTLVAMAWQVYLLSNVPTALGITMMAMSIPHVLLSLFGGVVSDRFDRRWIMLGADLARGVAVVAIGVLSVTGMLKIWHLTVIAAFYGAGNAFFTPAFDALVPNLVPEQLLPQANSLDQFVRTLATRLLGPALGGSIIAGVGVGWAFIFDAATFAVSTACLIRLGNVRPVAPSKADDTASVWIEIREGLVFARTRVWLWGTFTAAMLTYLVFLGPAEVLLPYIVKNDLGGSARDLGMVFAMGGLGAVAASVIVAQRGMPRRNMTFIYVCWSLSTLAVAGYGFAHAPWQVMVACFTFNAIESAGLIVWLTTKQSFVPARLLGRISSLRLISIGLMPISYALAGPVAGVLGTRPTLIGAGILGAGINFAFLFLPGMRAVEGIRPGAKGEVPAAEVGDVSLTAKRSNHAAT